jgi:hypothetical protein
MKKTIQKKLIPFGVLLFLGISTFGQIASLSTSNRQLDFLIGDWELCSPSNEAIGEVKVQLVFGTHTLEENFKGENGLKAQSNFNFDANRQLWVKTWSDDFGNELTFKGAFVNNKLVLNATSTNSHGKKTFHRIIYKKQLDGTVVKVWQKSSNNKTWTTTYSGVYKRKKAVL